MHSRDVETDPAAIQIRINPKIRIRIQITFVSRSGLLIYVSRKAGQWRFALFECFCDYFTVFFFASSSPKGSHEQIAENSL